MTEFKTLNSAAELVRTFLMLGIPARALFLIKSLVHTSPFAIVLDSS